MGTRAELGRAFAFSKSFREKATRKRWGNCTLFWGVRDLSARECFVPIPREQIVSFLLG